VGVAQWAWDEPARGVGVAWARPKNGLMKMNATLAALPALAQHFCHIQSMLCTCVCVWMGGSYSSCACVFVHFPWTFCVCPVGDFNIMNEYEFTVTF